jgi:hypothetical protein
MVYLSPSMYYSGVGSLGYRTYVWAVKGVIICGTSMRKVLNRFICKLNLSALIRKLFKGGVIMKQVSLYAAIVLIFCSIQSPNSASYYIDFSSGSDSNSGTRVSPWKRCPGMLGASGKVKTYSWISGDTFIFKGGVSWDSTCFPDTVGSGYKGDHYTFKSDSSWFSGASFAKPKFNLMKKQMASVVVNWYHNYVTWNGFEIFDHKGLPLGSNPSCFELVEADGVVLTNLYVHDWHPPKGIVNSSGACVYANACSLLTVTNNVFVGIDSGGNGMVIFGSRGGNFLFKNNFIDYCNCGILISGLSAINTEISYNTITRIYQGDYDNADHTNAIFVYASGNGSIHHNIVHDVKTMCMWENGGNWLVYDNTIYNTNGTQAANWENTKSSPACSVRFYNNYIEGDYIVTERGTQAGYLELRNNVLNCLFIGDTITKIVIDDNLYKQDSASNPSYITYLSAKFNRSQARARGWDSGSVFSTNTFLNVAGIPLNPKSPVIRKGKNLYNSPDSKFPDFTVDLAGKIRPSTTNWTIGGYEPDATLFILSPEPKGKLLNQNGTSTKKSEFWTYPNPNMRHQNLPFVYNTKGQKFSSHPNASNIVIQ